MVEGRKRVGCLAARFADGGGGEVEEVVEGRKGRSGTRELGASLRPWARAPPSQARGGAAQGHAVGTGSEEEDVVELFTLASCSMKCL